MKKYFTIIFVLVYFFGYSQYDYNEAKEIYKDMVNNPNYTWIYHTETFFKLPNELHEFIQKLNEIAKKGKIEITDLENNPLPPSYWDKQFNKIDTIILLHPLTLDTSIGYEKREFNDGQTNFIDLNEVWYFDNETKEIKSTINYYSPFFDLYDLNGNKKGSRAVYKKWNENVIPSKNTEKFTILRVIKFDTIMDNENFMGYQDLLDYQVPIKMLYNETLNKIIINEITAFEVVDIQGNKIQDKKSAVRYKNVDEVYGLIEFDLHYLGIIRFEVEEEWTVDYENFNISKKIIKLTPVTRYFPNIDGEKEQKSFSIVFN